MEIVRLTRAPQPSWDVHLDEAVVARASAGPGSEATACFLRLFVEPAYRRRGIGRRLLDAVVRDLLAASYLTIEAVVGVGGAGDKFADGLGAVVGDELVEDTLDMADLDVESLERIATQLPPGHELGSWRDPAPPSIVGSYAQAKRMIMDAPNRHPPKVPPWTAALVRRAEEERAVRGATMWVAAATYDGRVVAFSEISTDDSLEAAQHDTVVVAGHRRRGLASCVKADLILRLHSARPDIRSVSVTCAVANAGMRAVNHRLGFRERCRRRLVRLPLIGRDAT